MSLEQPQARHYVLSIPVTITDNDDLMHFQPDTVVAETPLGHAWVAGNDGEALANFFAFFVETHIPQEMSIAEFSTSDICRQQKEALRQIVLRAVHEHQPDADKE